MKHSPAVNTRPLGQASSKGVKRDEVKICGRWNSVGRWHQSSTWIMRNSDSLVIKSAAVYQAPIASKISKLELEFMPLICEEMG